jgi:hypothetical protein
MGHDVFRYQMYKGGQMTHPDGDYADYNSIQEMEYEYEKARIEEEREAERIADEEWEEQCRREREEEDRLNEMEE